MDTIIENSCVVYVSFKRSLKFPTSISKPNKKRSDDRAIKREKHWLKRTWHGWEALGWINRWLRKLNCFKLSSLLSSDSTSTISLPIFLGTDLNQRPIFVLISSSRSYVANHGSTWCFLKYVKLLIEDYIIGFITLN